MYLMFVLVGAGGLMATAQLAPVGRTFKIAEIPVSLVGITLPALTFALAIDRISTASRGRSWAGYRTNIGRELTMLTPSGLRIGIMALSI